ncbi:MAG: ubiquinol oxidase subunit II [Candidatus Microsaccharimonas sp.]
MKKTNKRVARRVLQVVISGGVAVLFIAVLAFVTQSRDVPVLNPKGIISEQQYLLILITVGLGIFVVVPVFILLFSIAWKFRETNKKAKYQPDFDGHAGLEALWWGIPAIIIVALAIITAISTHALDPYKPIVSDAKPVKVQVIALQWRWLFIYPEEGIATLNYLNIPEDRPVDLTITSDAPMNSFWVPALAGQVYAMSGMSSKLHLMANEVGIYEGMSANMSGEGFATMRFKVHAMQGLEYTNWVNNLGDGLELLDYPTYQAVASKSTDTTPETFRLADTNIYDTVVMKYMHSTPEEMNHSDMNHDGMKM